VRVCHFVYIFNTQNCSGNLCQVYCKMLRKYVHVHYKSCNECLVIHCPVLTWELWPFVRIDLIHFIAAKNEVEILNLPKVVLNTARVDEFISLAISQTVTLPVPVRLRIMAFCVTSRYCCYFCLAVTGCVKQSGVYAEEHS